MDNIQHSTGLVKADKLESYVECGKRCNVESECVTWTYVEGVCYLKTDNTFKQRNKYRSCGIKNCTGSGKHSFHDSAHMPLSRSAKQFVILPITLAIIG